MAYLSLTTVIPPHADVASTVAAAVAAAPGDSRILRVPVYREFIADLETPVSTYLKLHDGATSSFLLETVEGGERLGRYSFVGSDPADTIRVGEGCPHSGDPLTVLESFLKQSRLVIPRGVKLPEFTGGAVGYVGYDCVRFFEPRTAGALTSQTDVLHIPDAIFLIANTVVVFDHVRHTIKIVGHASVAPTASVAEIDTAYATACADIEGVLARLSRPLSFRLQAPPSSPIGKTQAAGGGAAAAHPSSPTALPVPLAVASPTRSSLSEPQQTFDWDAASNMGRAGYEGAVRSLQEHVVNGNIIQAVPSHRVSRALPPGVSAFDVYRQLRVVNPSPYMFFLHLSDDFQIVGASPEMLVRVDGKGMCFTHPIAGTRRRGADDKEDDELAAELLADEKERAEHIMLVDLGRNDLGRVASPGSVHVDSLMHVERYSHVMHIVTNLSARLAPGRTCFDAFRSVFPAGTVSGAPKVMAVELVAGLERERRHIYAGAVGYFGYSGVMDTAIAIRTLVVRDNSVYLQAGAGIVHDSVPASEYDETVSKMRATSRAVEAAIAASLSG